jgi:hypothetical protein
MLTVNGPPPKVTVHPSIFRFPFSVFRFPLSAFRFPLSAFRFPLSALHSIVFSYLNSSCHFIYFKSAYPFYSFQLQFCYHFVIISKLDAIETNALNIGFGGP